MRRKLPIAVIDNTLLSRLLELGLADQLSFLFSRIHIPADVKREASKAPGRVRRRLKKLMRENPLFWHNCTEEDSDVRTLLTEELDPGEVAVIAQVEKLKAVAIIDENNAYATATRMSIEVHRTGSILCKLKEAGAIPEVRRYLVGLCKLGFWIEDKICRQILANAGEPEPAFKAPRQR